MGRPALLLLGGGLMIAEIHVGHGALGAMGVVAVRGSASFLLFDNDQDGLQVSIPLIVGTAVVLVRRLRVHRLAHRKGRDAYRRPRVSRRSSGASARCGRRSIPEGLVFVHGELWAAVSDGRAVPVGSGVVIERLEGFTLHVHPAPLEEVRS